MKRRQIPGLLLVAIALILIIVTIQLKERNIFSVMLWETNETNIAGRINWTNDFSFITNPANNSCLFYITSLNATLNETIHGRNVFFSSSSSKYIWCDDSDATVIMTSLASDKEKYFSTFFKSREVECIEDSDCGKYDSDCDKTADKYKQCVSEHCVTPTIVCQCYTTETDNCKQTRYTDNDCSIFFAPEKITVDGTCDKGTCKYPEREIKSCSSLQLFLQKYHWYVFGGLALIVILVIYFYRRNQ